MSALRTLFLLTAGSRLTLLTLTALGLVASFIETISISLVVYLLYRVALGAEYAEVHGYLGELFSLVNEIAAGSAYRLGLAIAIAVIVRQTIVAAYEQLSAHAANFVYHRLRTELFTQYLSVPYGYIARKEYGELTNTIQLEAWRVSEAVQKLSRVLINLSALTIYLVVVSLLSWKVAIVVLAFGSAMTALTQLFRRRLGTLSCEVTDVHEQLAERLVTSVHAMRTIRAYGVESAEIMRYATLSERLAHMFNHLSAVDNFSRPFLELFSIGAIASIIWLSQDVGNSTATTVAILALLLRVQPQAREVQGHLMSLLGSAGPLNAVWNSISEAKKQFQPNGFQTTITFADELVARDLTFVHHGSDSISLRCVTFRLEPGKTTALVGASGSGKTTVVNLLLRLYEPSGGTIVVDGVNLSDIDRNSWLQQIAVAGQDVDLTEGSILDNVRLARPTAPLNDVEEALRLAGIIDFIGQLPDGVSTMVGERGLQLSGGQRQRIGLARAILKEPAILILDEALNAVDPIAEDLILDGLRGAYPRLSILLVTHRPESLKTANVVVRLENGQTVHADDADILAGSNSSHLSGYRVGVSR
jgi:ATP-binding cassette, subfamily B, bacterial MsbA